MNPQIHASHFTHQFTILRADVLPEASALHHDRPVLGLRVIHSCMLCVFHMKAGKVARKYTIGLKFISECVVRCFHHIIFYFSSDLRFVQIKHIIENAGR